MRDGLTYSVLAHKSTRGSKLLAKNLTREAAVKHAGEACDWARDFFNTGILVSGVAMLVVTDEDAAEMCLKGIQIIDNSRVLYQAGSF